MSKTFYEFLCEEQAAGRLQTYFNAGVMNGMLRKMEIYKFHLEHQKMSQWNMSQKFSCSKAYIRLVYLLMEQIVA